MNIYKYYNYIKSIPKTIYINFKYLRLKDAIKFPIIFSSNMKIYKAKGSIKINSKVKTAMIRIGFGNVDIYDKNRRRGVWNVNGQVVFNGEISIGHGSKIVVHSGTLIFGNNVSITAESSIICSQHIEFGDNCLISWDNQIMDKDFHSILNKSGEIINKPKEIIIGKHVWIGSRCTILKGVSISDNTVIAANSCVCKKFNEQNVIIGGNPAKVIKKEIEWHD